MNDGCSLCPRKCGADRILKKGYCGASWDIEVSKIMLHHWEEPPISGYNTDIYEDMENKRGSGAIFFTHCPLGCVYCQNSKISRRNSSGTRYTPENLAEEMLSLEEGGAYNINLVSPTQYTLQLIEAVKIAKKRGLSLPIVWNTGGYELPETIRLLDKTVDVYLTDFKYVAPELAECLSNAFDYPFYAAKSLVEMYKTVGKSVFDGEGMMKRGIIVRHLVLPSHRDDSIAVLNKIAELVPPEGIILSLMAQYTPEFLPQEERFHDISRKITTYEYSKVRDEAIKLGYNGFMQERSSATKCFTPDF